MHNLVKVFHAIENNNAYSKLPESKSKTAFKYSTRSDSDFFRFKGDDSAQSAFTLRTTVNATGRPGSRTSGLIAP
jgi:hypothetical protein